jgi:hypothetical protein
VLQRRQPRHLCTEAIFLLRLPLADVVAMQTCQPDLELLIALNSGLSGVN